MLINVVGWKYRESQKLSVIAESKNILSQILINNMYVIGMYSFHKIF